jgi:predicted methyltransferase
VQQPTKSSTPLLITVLALCSPLLASAQNLSTENRQDLQTLIDSDFRSAPLLERNQFRHPLETLDFFNIEPELAVAEIWPGGQGGWYRSILEPYLIEQGKYIPVRSDSTFPTLTPEVPNNSMDRVLVFRAHGFMIYDKPAQQYFNAIYAMLKPGAIFGIVDHRGNELVPQDPKGANGYVNQSHVLMMATKAGFKLLETSEINANPNDTKNYKDGVYSLPPTLRGSLLWRSFRRKMLNIGESDRMTLKFIKP